MLSDVVFFLSINKHDIMSDLLKEHFEKWLRKWTGFISFWLQEMLSGNN